MKKIALLAALAFAASVGAQPAKEPAKPAAQEPQKRVVKKANPRRQEDARHCLDKSTNTEVIKCAEAYL
jgi:hypothetical protein